MEGYKTKGGTHMFLCHTLYSCVRCAETHPSGIQTRSHHACESSHKPFFSFFA